MQTVSLVFEHFGIRLSASAYAAIRQRVLVAQAYLMPHQEVRNHLATRTRGLMWRARVIFVRSFGASFFT